MTDDRLIMIDAQNVKKKYIIRHNTEKPSTFSGRLKLVARKVFRPSKRYDKEDFWALNGVSFQVRKGEKVGIIGKNGAGKSTLLKILSRITEPTDGRIELLGKVSAMLEVGTGFNGELTGRENVYLNGAILGMTKAEIDAKFDEIVEFSEVGRFIDTPVKRYSSGMFVRLAFAVASHLDPDILIVDEVLSVGDTKFQRKCITQMMNIAQSGKTILYVSHQMQTIQQLCDRVIVLKAGKIIFDGNVEDGIAMYTESIDTTETKKDLSNHKPRGTQMAVVESVEAVNKDSCTWLYNEPIHLNVKVKANDDCEDLRFEFMIRDMTDKNLGKSESEPLGKMEKGKTYEYDVVIRNENILAPDKYTLGIELWKIKENLATIYDVVVEALSIEILGEDEARPDVPSLFWEPNIVGNMMLPTAETKLLS
ncbi:MAG: ABC transporter ATP-binding protein [Clostridia bacterium]|nr:ABC transporter ATP-binding protein [Clostridia bacterium]